MSDFKAKMHQIRFRLGREGNGEMSGRKRIGEGRKYVRGDGGRMKKKGKGVLA